MKFKDLSKKVHNTLRDYPETRNSDIALTIQIWKSFYNKKIKIGKSGEEGVWLKDLYELPREDIIKRIRAHYQNVEHIFLPTEWKIAKQRRINEIRWKEYMRGLMEYKRI